MSLYRDMCKVPCRFAMFDAAFTWFVGDIEGNVGARAGKALV